MRARPRTGPAGYGGCGPTRKAPPAPCEHRHLALDREPQEPQVSDSGEMCLEWRATCLDCRRLVREVYKQVPGPVEVVECAACGGDGVRSQNCPNCYGWIGGGRSCGRCGDCGVVEEPCPECGGDGEARA